MSDGLKPCPWCGEEHICLFDEHDDEGLSFAVGCVSEDCHGHVAISWHYDTKEKAIEAWNTRAERTCVLRSRLTGPYCYECSECGKGMKPEWAYCPRCGAKVGDTRCRLTRSAAR